jgi:uncharacterized lipoprotein YmbA
VIRATRRIALAALVVLASGCLNKIFPSRPSLEQYILQLRTDSGVPARPTGAPVLTGALAVSPYVTRGIYSEPGIVFRTDDIQLSAYPSREWAIPLRDMLGALTEQALRTAPLSVEPAVFDPRTMRAHDYQWRGTVRELEVVDRGRNVLAAVHLEVEIIRTANDSVVWKGSERIERPVPPPTSSMPRVVETLSAITTDVVKTLIERARTDLGSPAAGTARRER